MSSFSTVIVFTGLMLSALIMANALPPFEIRSVHRLDSSDQSSTSPKPIHGF